MAKKKRSKGNRGHYCRGCAKYLPNEKFGGKGHSINLCKKCKNRKKRTWEEIDQKDSVQLFVPEELSRKLETFSMGQPRNQSIYTSIALSLYVAGEVTLEEGAYLADMSFTDFLSFLEKYHIPWCVGDKDGHIEHQKSHDDLILFVDRVFEWSDE